jgi:predicted DsbA family dithiol-disulfide isomerase
MTERSTGFRIDIYSDVICPWCYVGKRRLERALTVAGIEARVTWRPFQLNPTMPLDGMDRKVYLAAKFGSLETFGRMEEQLVAVGVGEGIPFAFDKIKRTPNTFLAHRLIWYAERQGRQDETVESLFHAYFIEGQDIGHVTTLVQVAGEAGIEPAEAESFLASDTGMADVKAEEATSHRMGIRAVPHFVLEGRYAISGAVRADKFVAALKTIEAEREVEKASL